MTQTKATVYQTITGDIINAMETSGTDWIKPFLGGGAPVNLEGRPYTGINRLVLGLKGGGRWGTYRAIKAAGGQVRRGERGTTGIYYLAKGKEVVDGVVIKEGFMAGIPFTVFSTSQTDGLEALATVAGDAVDAIQAADEFIEATGAVIIEGDDGAYYRPATDTIHLPKTWRNTAHATATAGRYMTALHELSHWSGAANRLDRTFGQSFGDSAYAAEELVAELTSAYLSSDLGITGDQDAGHIASHAKYLTGWIKALKADPNAIFQAARMATKSAAYLHGERG